LVPVLDEAPALRADADVRLWVDRVFTVAGAGTVVTGTLPAGTVRVGDVLSLGESEIRVRGVESLGRELAEVTGPARVALRLGGRVPAGLMRGVPLTTPAAFAAATEIDVALAGDGDLPERPLLHLGSGRQEVHLRPLGGRFARLQLRSSLPVRVGDRLVVRDPGSRRLWGADVLDVDPPALARRGAARRRADQLDRYRPDVSGELARRGAVRASLLRRWGLDPSAVPDDAASAGDWLVSGEQLDTWRARLLGLLATHPEGMSPPAVARLLGVPDSALVGLLATPPVVVRAGRLVLDSPLPDALARALDAIATDLAGSPFRSPDAERLAALGLDPASLQRLVRDGHLLSVGDGVVLLRGADDVAFDVLGRLEQPFTTSEARQALGTSRRVILPLLSYLDRTGRTRRLPDNTRCVITPGVESVGSRSRSTGHGHVPE
jgi:selenocysteine-specific elongation factor